MPIKTIQVPPYVLSDHAKLRMQQRGISRVAVEQVLCYGRTVHVRGAEFHVLGRKEVRSNGGLAANLAPAEGVHLVMSEQGVVITVYRTHALCKLRGKKHSQRQLH